MSTPQCKRLQRIKHLPSTAISAEVSPQVLHCFKKEKKRKWSVNMVIVCDERALIVGVGFVHVSRIITCITLTAKRNFLEMDKWKRMEKPKGNTIAFSDVLVLMISLFLYWYCTVLQTRKHVITNILHFQTVLKFVGSQGSRVLKLLHKCIREHILSRHFQFSCNISMGLQP
jgi:hypothetical protein